MAGRKRLPIFMKLGDDHLKMINGTKALPNRVTQAWCYHMPSPSNFPPEEGKRYILRYNKKARYIIVFDLLDLVFHLDNRSRGTAGPFTSLKAAKAACVLL